MPWWCSSGPIWSPRGPARASRRPRDPQGGHVVLKGPHMILKGCQMILKAAWHNPQGASGVSQPSPFDEKPLGKIMKSKVLGNLMGRQGHLNGGPEELHHKHLNWTYQKPLGKSWNHEIMTTDTWKTIRNIIKWWDGIESDTWWIGVAPEWSNWPSRNLCQPIKNP